jgi:hypothetical protein
MAQDEEGIVPAQDEEANAPAEAAGTTRILKKLTCKRILHHE